MASTAPSLDSTAIVPSTTATVGTAAGRVSLASLALKADELPVGMELLAEDSSTENELSFVYVNPAATNPASGYGLVTAVVSAVTIAGDDVEAERLFVGQGSLSANAVSQELRGSDPSVSNARAEQLGASIPGADHSLVFRVAYNLGDLRLVEYRFRVRVGNVVANTVVTSRADSNGGEPSTLRSLATGLMTSQVARLSDAAN